jgi:hypothetical protein
MIVIEANGGQPLEPTPTNYVYFRNFGDKIYFAENEQEAEEILKMQPYYDGLDNE